MGRNRPDPVLTSGQVACLNLVAKNLTSKEIALQLGISPHTVDQRIRRALQLLGTPNRRQAARLVESRDCYWKDDRKPPARTKLERSKARTVPVLRRPRGRAQPRAATPVAAPPCRDNRMGVVECLCWIGAIGISAGLSLWIYLVGLECLGRILEKG